MASRKRNSKQLKKRRSHKRRSMKRKMKGGCGCGGGSGVAPLMKGGGDYFLQGYKEPPSFNEVPLRSFYSNNTYAEGTDVQGGQISSRLMPNMNGGKRKSKKVRFLKKMKGGAGISFPFMNSFTDPLMRNDMNAISSQGGVSGAMLGRNIVGGVQEDNYSPSHISFPKTGVSLV